MADVQQLQDDLQFVRHAVARRESDGRRPAAIYWVWAVYVLVAYTLLDQSPRMAGLFFMFGGLAGGIASFWLGKRFSLHRGEFDNATRRRAMLHFMGGCILAVACGVLLTIAIPLTGAACGQLIVTMIGIVYFLAGIHFDRNFLWLGPVLMVGGAVVGFFPHHGWTGLGVIIALGLTVPTLFRSVPTQTSAAH